MKYFKNGFYPLFLFMLLSCGKSSERYVRLPKMIVETHYGKGTSLDDMKKKLGVPYNEFIVSGGRLSTSYLNFPTPDLNKGESKEIIFTSKNGIILSIWHRRN